MSTRKPDLDERPWRQYICLACGLCLDDNFYRVGIR